MTDGYKNYEGQIFIQEHGSLHSYDDTSKKTTRIPPSSTKCMTLSTPAQEALVFPLKVPSLLTICTKLVAHNLSWVDSFVGLPEIIGRLIFDEALSGGLFVALSRAVLRDISLFVSAYGGCVLERVDLSDCQLLCAEFDDLSRSMFAHITKLDVSRCKLGDGHDLVTDIAQLTRLESLNLTDNELSNHGIRKLTTPIRLLGKGFGSLKDLNLSLNPLLTDDCSVYLHCLTMLNCLDVSSCSFTGKGVQRICKKLALEKSSVTASYVTYPTCGWASCVIDSWRRTYNCRKTHRRKPKLNFYGRNKNAPLGYITANEPPIATSEIVLRKRTTHSNSNSCLTNIEPNRVPAQTDTSKKRKPTSPCTSPRNNGPLKAKKTKINQEDLQLAASYL